MQRWWCAVLPGHSAGVHPEQSTISAAYCQLSEHSIQACRHGYCSARFPVDGQVPLTALQLFDTNF